MRVLVATIQSQGQRPNDFCTATDGEMVIERVFVCDPDPDSLCGCARSWEGTQTRGFCTTARVIDVPDGDRLQTGGAVLRSLGDWGFPETPSVVREAQRLADKMLAIAEDYPVGAILEIRGTDIHARIWD